MNFPGSYRLRRLARRLAPKAIILLYHRVTRAFPDPQLLCVTPEHFAEHMQVLNDLYRPVRLRRFRRDFWAPDSVAVTFDDGYADNLNQAGSILEKYNMPATIFVTSGKVDSQEEFWWDELERILLLSPVLPSRLELRIGDRQHAWEIAKTGFPDSPVYWNVLSGSHPTFRQQAYLDLMKLLRDLDAEALEAVLKKLRAWARLESNASRQDWRAVKVDELCSLPAEGLIDIGAHTVNHTALSKLAPDCQKREILESKSALEKILGRPVETFAYPFGERNDYTRQTISIVKDAGFSCACSNFAGQVTPWSDPYQLPRFVVRDWDGDTFAHQLREWFRER